MFDFSQAHDDLKNLLSPERKVVDAIELLHGVRLVLEGIEDVGPVRSYHNPDALVGAVYGLLAEVKRLREEVADQDIRIQRLASRLNRE